MNTLVTGGSGLVGSAIESYFKPSSKQLNLMHVEDIIRYITLNKIDSIIHCAAKVGGIKANSDHLGEFFYKNVIMNTNLLHAAHETGVKKVVSFMSTCVFSDDVEYPLTPCQIHMGEPHPSNYAYAYAKRMLEVRSRAYRDQYGSNFVTVIPCNIYGPNDNFNLDTSHVLPAIFRKIYLGKCLQENNWDAIIRDINQRPLDQIIDLSSNIQVLAGLEKYGINENSIEIWGSGKPLREFLWADDLADACLYLMEKINFKDLYENNKEIRNTHINIGSSEEISIKDLAMLIKNIIGYKGSFIFNTTKPDGTFKKTIDSSKINSFGWKNKVSLREGIKRIYSWYIA